MGSDSGGPRVPDDRSEDRSTRVHLGLTTVLSGRNHPANFAD